MASGNPRPTVADTVKQLTEQAEALWGERRAAELRQSLEDTARALTELRDDLPIKSVEPGFYP